MLKGYFGDNSNLNGKCFEQCSIMNGKMIFMFLSPIWGIVEKFKGKFKHLVHKTWPPTCGWIVFKFYKKQMKSENREICRDTVLSYVETVVKKLRGFRIFYHICCLRIETSQRKIRNFHKRFFMFVFKFCKWPRMEKLWTSKL